MSESQERGAMSRVLEIQVSALGSVFWAQDTERREPSSFHSTSFDFKGQYLACGGATGPRRKRLDVNEYVLSALRGFQETEAALVVPGLEGSGKSHRT